MSEKPKDVEPRAVTIRVNDLYEWLDMVVRMDGASRNQLPYNNEIISGPKWIYRGQANSSWIIASSFERLVLPKMSGSVKKDENALRTREKAAMAHFRQWVEINDMSIPTAPGEWLALMQHYLVPTRLVDFSETPALALGFALEDKTECKSDFAVWAVKRNLSSCCYAQSQAMKKLIDYAKSEPDRQVRKSIELIDTQEYAWREEEFDRMWMDSLLGNQNECIPTEPQLVRYIPLCMNSRQKRQRGLFLTSTHLSSQFMPLLHTWTGTNARDLQDSKYEMYVTDANVAGEFNEDVANAHLIKYVFDKKLRGVAETFLRCCNITDLTRYGGIEKLASETKSILIADVL